MIDIEVGISEIEVNFSKKDLSVKVFRASNRVMFRECIGCKLRCNESIDWENNHVEVLFVVGHGYLKTGYTLKVQVT